jgi:hypothetical protein
MTKAHDCHGRSSFHVDKKRIAEDRKSVSGG